MIHLAHGTRARRFSFKRSRARSSKNVTFVRRKLATDLAAKGYIQTRIDNLTRLLNAEYLTVVYARRFARYKRATLILKDKERLASILSNATKPVQLIFAGKAHPADDGGKRLIQEIFWRSLDPRFEGRIAFAEDKVILEDVQREEERVAREDSGFRRVGLDLDASAGLFRHLVNHRIRGEARAG